MNKTIETLERRVLLDGEVTAFVAGGDLFVRGDDGDNHVQVLQPQPGTIRVLGLDETTVNGEESVDFAVELDDVRINTRQGGEDEVEIQGPLAVGDNVLARLGDEGEFIVEGTLGPVEVGGNVTVLPGSQSDVRFRNEVVVHGRTIAPGRDVTAHATPGVIPDFEAANFSNPLDIDNPYSPLVPGTLYTHEEREVDDETGEVEITTVTNEVTNDTRTILGVQVRVVRAIERVEGRVIEDTFDWYAQDDNGNVWYFGEDTTSFDYDDEGNLIGQSSGGSFEAGMDGARAGVIMLARPQAGDAYFEEVLVGEAIDQAEVLGTDETVTDEVLGTVTNVLRTENATALEPDALEQKLYAPGFGLLREIKIDPLTGEEEALVRLVSATRDGQPVTQLVAPDNPQGANATGREVGQARFDHVAFGAARDVIVRGVRFEDDNASFNAQNDLIALDARFAGEPVFLSRAAAGLRGLEVAGETYIRGGEEVVITDSTFADDVYVRFHEGDNELAVGGSTFGTLSAAGGAGENIFVELDGNEIENLRLKDFAVEEEEEED